MTEIRTRPGSIGNAITETRDEVFMEIRLLSKIVTEIYDTKLRPFGVSAIQFSLLDVIARMGPATRAAIARTQQLDKSTLTRDLKSVFAAGWVEEVRDQADGRSRPIAITKLGKELQLNAQSAWLAAEAEIKALLGQQAMAAVTGSVDRLARRLKRCTSDAPPWKESAQSS